MSNADSQNRFFDKTLGKMVIQVLPGESYVTNRDEAIVTVLGSCISVCMRDPLSGIGGMNHFLLPDQKDNEVPEQRYGSYAMEILIDSILKLSGTETGLEVKIFGGGNMFNSAKPIGERNILFVREYLNNKGYLISGEDVGRSFSRKIRYFPATGKVQVKRLETLHNKRILTAEKDLEQYTINSTLHFRLE